MKILKKILGIAMIGVLAANVLAGCGKKEETKKITIGVCAGPYGEMVKQAISPILEKKGYKVKITEFSDYILPDKALANGEIDANLMQHTVYLEKFASDNKLDIDKIVTVPTAGAGIFSNSRKSLAELKDGDKVAIPNDPSNLARALGILAKENVITLKKGIDDTKASENDIASNPKKLEFETLDAAQISRNLDSVAIGVIPGNYAYAANLDFGDALALETLAEGYKNVIAVKSEDVDSQLGKDLKAAVESEEFYKTIIKDGSKFKNFQKPKWWIEKYGK